MSAVPPERLASAVRSELDRLVNSIGEQVENRSFRASNELQDAIVYVLRGQRSGRIYNVPNAGRVKYDRKNHTAKIIHKKYQASAPDEAPAARTGIFRRSWRPVAYANNRHGPERTVHATVESGYKVNGKLLLGEILENGTKRMQPRPFADKTKKMALPKILKIYRESYRR